MPCLQTLRGAVLLSVAPTARSQGLPRPPVLWVSPCHVGICLPNSAPPWLPSPLRRGPKEHQELRQIGKPDADSQHRLKKLEGVEGASLSIHKKNMALQKLKKDPLDSLHQRGTCYVSEACHPPLLGAVPWAPAAASPPPGPSWLWNLWP